MKDFFAFRRMITPTLIRVLFIVGLIFVIIMGILAIVQGFMDMDGKTVLSGFMILILGPIGVRVYLELLAVLFMINENLFEIRKNRDNLINKDKIS